MASRPQPQQKFDVRAWIDSPVRCQSLGLDAKVSFEGGQSPNSIIDAVDADFVGTEAVQLHPGMAAPPLCMSDVPPGAEFVNASPKARRALPLDGVQWGAAEAAGKAPEAQDQAATPTPEAQEVMYEQAICTVPQVAKVAAIREVIQLEREHSTALARAQAQVEQAAHQAENRGCQSNTSDEVGLFARYGPEAASPRRKTMSSWFALPSGADNAWRSFGWFSRSYRRSSSA